MKWHRVTIDRGNDQVVNKAFQSKMQAEDFVASQLDRKKAERVKIKDFDGPKFEQKEASNERGV